MTILLDFETRSRCDLKAHGGRLYGAHPSTEALCAVLYDTETGDVGLWTPGDPPPVTADDEQAAHNAMGFDRFIAARLGWPAPRNGWVDTSEAARRAGLPGALDALGKRWLGLEKDKDASRFTKGLSRPSRAKARQGQLPEITHEVLRRVVAYCASDVEIMAHGWEPLSPYLTEGVFAGWEADVSTVDRIVNDRGVAFDTELAARLLECDRVNQERAIEDAAQVLGWGADQLRSVVSSPAQFCAYTGLENAQAATIEAILADPSEVQERRAFASARQALATIASGKLRAGLARVSRDGRMRDSHRYYGAHTGRWSGKGMQLQNLPRPEKRFEGWVDEDVCALVDRAFETGSIDDGEIMVALRACITGAPGNALVVSDFSGVEARALAWCAGDRGALEVFASGRDPYKTAAAPMFRVSYDEVTKVQRNAGKMAELACGYGGGENALLKIAGQNRFSFSDAGVDPKAVVASYRALHAPIVRFWRALEDAFLGAIRGETRRVDRFEFVPSSCGRDVAVFLPSGRPIVYNGVGVSRGPYGPSPYYVGNRGVEHVYGGKIAENVIQASCRDLLADSLVRAEEAGLCPVLHVHDEIVCEVPANAAEEGLRELDQIMRTLPEWATGFPVGAAGHHGRRYRK